MPNVEVSQPPIPSHLPTSMLHAFQALVSSLSHQIRTPLSIISNDLTYWSSRLPAGETDRADQQVRLVADILARLQAFCRYTDSYEVVSVSELLGLTSDRGAIKVRVRPNAMRKVLELGIRFVDRAGDGESSWCATVTSSSVVLSAGASQPVFSPVPSFVSAVALEFGENSVPDAVFIESIVSDSAGELFFSKSPACFAIRIPLVTV